MAVTADYQRHIAESGAIDSLIPLLSVHMDIPAPSRRADLVRYAVDALAELAHENAQIKTLIVARGAIPRLVALLTAWNPRVRRASLRALSTLAHNYVESHHQVFHQETLEVLITMLAADEPCIGQLSAESLDQIDVVAIHHEAVFLLGIFVNSSNENKFRVAIE